MSLDRRNHAGHHTGTVAERWSAPEQANCFGLDARPRTSSEFAQQLAVEPSVQPKTLGDGQDDLPMRDGKTDFFSNVDGGQEIFLSNAVRHYQALDQADIPVKLDLYEGMWHIFQVFNYELPESKLARKKVRVFLERHLKD